MSEDGVIIARLEDGLPIAVPRSREEIESLVSVAVHVLWQCRRYGESWDDVTAPQSYLDDDVTTCDRVGALSRRVYRRLIFDLVAEILRDIYADDDDEPVETPDENLYARSWARRRPAARPPRCYTIEHPVPTTVDGIKPVVEHHVLVCLGLAAGDQLLAAETRTTAARRRGVERRMRDDAVDRMLVEELCLEEAGWIDYDDDVTTRKLQLSNFLIEALLADTVFEVDSAMRRRTHALTSLGNLV